MNFNNKRLTKSEIRLGMSILNLHEKHGKHIINYPAKLQRCHPINYWFIRLAQIAAHYPIRWKIETCFKHLKSNGFNLEEMNLGGEERCKLMMAVVVFAYTLSVCEGLKEYKKVPVKKYKSGLVTKPYSAFRMGLDKLSAFCYKMEAFLICLIENLVNKLPLYKSKYSIIV